MPSSPLQSDGRSPPPPRRVKLLGIYIALIGTVILAITIGEGYHAYALRDPAVPIDLGDLIGTLVGGRYPFDVLRVLGFAALGLGYLLPLFIADFRGHHDRATIGLVNVAFGWTIIGWLAAGCWAAMPTMGLRALLADAKKRTSPALERSKENLAHLGRGVEQHPLTRDVKRNLDRLLGGKLQRYVPPPEGVETLIANWSVVRDIEGAVNLSARLLLPMGTRLSLCITRSGEEAYSTRCVLDSEGWLRVGPITNFGRPYPAGRYTFWLATLPFVFGVQEDWIIDAVGERGVSLPHSATQAADPEFPQHGRKLDATVVEEIPAPVLETGLIETVKQHRAVAQSGATAQKSVEEILHSRLAARGDEQPAAAPWSVEQVDTARWIVSFAFTRRGRPHRACWEVDDTGTVRYRDPEAKALSVE